MSEETTTFLDLLGNVLEVGDTVVMMKGYNKNPKLHVGEIVKQTKHNVYINTPYTATRQAFTGDPARLVLLKKKEDTEPAEALPERSGVQSDDPLACPRCGGFYYNISLKDYDSMSKQLPGSCFCTNCNHLYTVTFLPESAE